MTAAGTPPSDPLEALRARARRWRGPGNRDRAFAAKDEFIRFWHDADGIAAGEARKATMERARLRDTPARE